MFRTRLGSRPSRATLVIALAAALVACGPAPSAQTPGGPPGAGAGAAQAMPVGVRAVALQSVPILIDAVGQAEGSKEVEVRARVTGLIQKQLYREGERVKSGAPLFAIERAPFEIALVEARAMLAQEEARLEQSRREAQRLKPLVQQQAIAQRDYDNAATAARLGQATLAAARSRVREAELNLSYTVVNAPIAGLAGRAEKSEGALVGPSGDSLLTRVTQTDPVWVRFSFSVAEQERLRAGNASGVRMLDGNGKPVGETGQLNFTGSTVDSRLGTVQLRAQFTNPDLAVLPGQFVRAQVQAGEERVFLVPQAAVFSGDQGQAVWTIKDGKAVPAQVELGAWVGTDWVVRKGLNEGDAVIIDNLMKLRPGAPVVARSAAPAASAPAASAPAASR